MRFFLAILHIRVYIKSKLGVIAKDNCKAIFTYLLGNFTVSIVSIFINPIIVLTPIR